MARHVRAEKIEGVKRPVVAVGNDYPAGHLHATHAHRRSQLLFAELGMMLVETQHGTWMVPPHQGMWISGGVRHSIAMLSQVATRSVYLDKRAARGMPRQCEVVGVSPLLRQLLILAVDLPSEYDPRSRAGRIMSLLVDEIRLATACLPAVGGAPPAGWRGRDDDRLRPRLFEPGRLHDHVQEAGRHEPPRLSQGGIVSRTGLELAVCRGSR